MLSKREEGGRVNRKEGGRGGLVWHREKCSQRWRGGGRGRGIRTCPNCFMPFES